MSFGQRISSFFGRVDRQACFNIGMSFLAFSFAGQVYQAKVRVGAMGKEGKMKRLQKRSQKEVADFGGRLQRIEGRRIMTHPPPRRPLSGCISHSIPFLFS